MAYNKTTWQDHVVDNQTGQVIQQGTPVSAGNLNKIEQGIEDAHTYLSEQADQMIEIKRGANVITTDQATGLDVSFGGVTLQNILGLDGNCEDISRYSVFGTGTSETSQEHLRSGTSSFKFILDGVPYARFRDFSYKLDTAKQYVVGAWVYLSAYTGGNFSFVICDFGALFSRYTANINTSLLNQWQFVYVKIPTENAVLGAGFRLFIGNAFAPNMTVYADEIRLYEVDTAVYNAIGTTVTGQAIDALLPCVDGMQSLSGPYIEAPRKNLFRPFTEPLVISSAALTVTIQEPYVIDLTTTSTTAAAYRTIEVVPGQNYTISCDCPGDSFFAVYNSVGTTPLLAYRKTLATFNSGSNTNVRVYFNKNTTSGTVRVSNPIVVLGNASNLPPSFIPYEPQCLAVPTTLHSLPNGVRDRWESRTGAKFKAVEERYLDGSLSWTLMSGETGYKKMIVNSWVTANNAAPATLSVLGIRADDSPLKAVSSGNYNAPNQIHFGLTALNLSVPNSYSGWVDDINPSNNAAKALFNGWRANGNNGTVYNSWTSILTGDAPATNTDVYVSLNKAPGWNWYAYLLYQRSIPVKEDIGAIGSISLSNGSSAVTLGEGAVLREFANPVLSGGVYRINNTTASGSLLANPTQKILAVYRDNELDMRWTVSLTNANGLEALFVAPADYDPAATYTVDYVRLDKPSSTTNIVDATASYQSTPGSVIARNVEDINRLKTNNSVQEWILLEYAARLLALEEA